MSHARVEELSDSDPEEIAPSDDDFADNVIIEPIAPRQANPPKATPAPAPAPAPPMMNQMPMNQVPEPTREIPKHFQCLYPIYFDKTRSRTDGRKVGSELAVENPLARDIVDAVQMLGLQAGLEPEKLHPKDWANPGRVRVLLKNEDGKSMNSKIKNKHHLYILVAQYLQAHPTDEKSPYRLRIRGLPMPEKLPEAPPAPRGWKIGKILPIHSPAYSGGGVSDNPFKEAMAEMQNMQGMPGMPQMPQIPGMPGMGMPGMPGGEGSGAGTEKKKKDKKKGKA
ncbi:Signal recognition particle SEC65 subunit [Penicillium cosmopolitanum]|uniref:Signal recognition particle SEC65 subunit n=1 Tax=Penicillium cosmopolitanum TaxID=1131564 RepID=A0A9W9VF32_9EURO|nr:Signal recognition particle SEC65 subunit [Penicillium cosmopolitanum]KAJ5378459.1 Signal recognition particle SEC65 subunit [Penicillium cosmopolitanum]